MTAGPGRPADDPANDVAVSGAGRTNRSPLVRRRRVLLWTAGALAGLSTGGLALSTRVKSPAQAAADARPPAPSTLTAPVQRRLLSETVVFRGTVSQRASVPVTVAAAWGAERAVVTGVRVRAGQSVKPGQVLAEVSGRPVIVLPGAVPAYRDMRPGAAGRDVAQLQKALRGLGEPVRREPTFGPSTKAAVERLYRRLGYPVPDTGPDDTRAVAAARTQLRTARSALARADAAKAPAAELAAARQAADQAERDLAELVVRTGPMVPGGEVVFVPGRPVRVTRLAAVVGRPPGEPLAVLGVGTVVVAGSVPAAEAAGVAVGAPAEVLSSRGGPLTGKVSLVGAEAAAVMAAARAGTADGDQAGSGPDGAAGAGAADTAGAVLVEVNGSIDPARVGESVRLTVRVSGTADPVLVVPVAAVAAAADGSVTVTVRGGDGRTRMVPVTVGRTGDGFVEVAAPDGGLTDGELVVVGAR